jgi:hypothetical protein
MHVQRGKVMKRDETFPYWTWCFLGLPIRFSPTSRLLLASPLAAQTVTK